ncbi:uncharacterized protein LOC128641576 [Bombina bombina]|uniref:uncharacterized protein LOC128641576 n=1 Tax=Bombina bombina TaxID=8345 RepID=UPI00235AD2AD|nr:uncharacterized protein LOC128641576 [Bombina bombina]
MARSIDYNELKAFISNFSLDSCTPHGNQGYNRVLLQLFGFAGHGKSSYINSCKYVVDGGDYKVYASVAEHKEAPCTMTRNAYELTGTITLVDNRGCVTMNKDETAEIYLQLGNFLPVDCKVSWERGFSGVMKTILASERDGQFTDFIVPIFVYSVEKSIADQEVEELKQLLRHAQEITGVLPTVVLTHETNENLAHVKEKFRQMGVRNIFPVENYTKEDHLKTRGKHETILWCLSEICKDVQFRMEERRDPTEEKIQRKEFLFTFAHERELEKQRLESERLAAAAKPVEIPPQIGLLPSVLKMLRLK